MTQISRQIDRTNVIGIELVYAHEHSDGGCTESPGQKGSKNREFAFVQIVD